MRSHGFRSKAVCLVLLLAVLVQGGCREARRTPSQDGGKEPLRVVTSIEPLAWFVQRIGGKRVSVSVMVPPGGNPHTYEPTPRQMALLDGAGIFVKAGSGVEFELDWMARFLAINAGLKVCDASEGVRLLPVDSGVEIHHDEHDAEEAEAHGHRHQGIDPHFWLSPSNGRIIAANVERCLTVIDPSHREEYAKNRAVVDRDLAELDRTIRKRLSGVPNRRFLVFHPAWGYYAREYGLVQIPVEYEGKTLTPVQMSRVIGVARSNGIRVLFASPQFSSVQAEAIARDIGGVTVMVDPLAREYERNLLLATDVFARSLQ